MYLCEGNLSQVKSKVAQSKFWDQNSNFYNRSMYHLVILGAEGAAI